MRLSRFTNIAHRGASAYAPENTVASFDKALELGAGHVEMDLHFSGDGQIVVIHDDTLDRTTNGTGPVASHTLTQLKQLDAGAWFADRYAGERVPSLGELLERYKGEFHFHLEIKARAEHLSERAIDLVRGYGWLDRVTITSFQREPLQQARSYAPELPTGWLVRELEDGMVAQAQQMGVAEICPHASLVTADLVDDLHGKGFMVRAYGVGDEEVMRRVVDAGVDGMTIDFPDKLAEYLKSKAA